MNIASTRYCIRRSNETENEKALAEALGENWSEEELVFKNRRRHIVQASNIDEINVRVYKKAGG